MRTSTLRSASLLAVLAAALSAPAASFTFTGGANALWNYQLNGQYVNWLNNQVSTGNANYDDEVHLGLASAAARLASTMNFSSTRLGRLVFDQKGGVDLNGNQIRVAGGGSFSVTSAAAHTMTNAVSLNDNGATTNTLTVDVTTSASLAASGVWSGLGSLVKTGAGTLILSGANTYSGGTTIRAGTLAMGSEKALGTGGLTLTGGTLDFGALSPTLGGLTFGDGATDGRMGTIAGSGTLRLAGDVTYRANTSGRSRWGRIDSATDLTAGQHVFGGSNLNNYSDIPDMIFTGAVSGEGGIELKNGFTLVFATPSSYKGPTTVTSGNIIVAVDNALPTYTALTLGTGCALNLDQIYTNFGTAYGSYSQEIGSLSGSGYVTGSSGTLTVGNLNTNTEFSGYIGVPTLVKVGTGTLTLTGGLYMNATVVHAGRLVVAQPRGSYTDEAVLEFAHSDDRGFGGTIVGSGAFVKSGSGTLTLSGANAYLGGTTVKGGTLKVGAANALPALGAIQLDAAGTLALNGFDATIGALNGTGAVVLGANPLAVGAGDGDGTFSGKLFGSGLFRKVGAGREDLSGANTSGFTGMYRIEGGILKGSTASIQNDVYGADGATLQFDQAKAGLYQGVYSGAGSLLKTGTKTLTLADVPVNTGGVRVSGGALDVAAGGSFGGGLTVDGGATFLNTSGDALTIDGRTVTQGEIATTTGSTTVFTGLVSGVGGFSGFGTVDFQGGYHPGNSPASVTFQGDLRLSSSLQMELGGIALGTGYDHLKVDGTAFLGGALNVAYYSGFSASLGQSFDLFDFSTTSGAFTMITLPSLGNGLVWNTSGLYTNGTISVQAVPEPASFAALGLGALMLMRRRKRA